MYELIQAAEHTYYIESPAKIGLVQTGDTVALIDSGSDKEAGRKVRQHLDARGLKLSAIYNTHSNADHIGGNQYLQRQTGCAVYAPGVEAAFTRDPILEPSFLYGGCPPKPLRHKFLLAQPSGVQVLDPKACPLEVIPLPGHFFDMVGYRTEDDVVFLADCLSSRETLEKYRVSFLYDVAAYLDTLDRVAAMEAALFVPAHTAATEDIAPLARYNRDQVYAVAEDLLDLLAEPLVFEEVLRRLFRRYHLTMDLQQYVLVGSTVKSYLAWLLDGGRVTAAFDDCRLLWRKA
ncbi:MAG TPA: MBL fold metallo-hydrolase [Candidatus Avoscillospira stercorigallinarum]|uniref:MBL fold metallo-hydrolase n=1 Tax=Candidatus Avoscillospira stercorigallinarum TaxID=2840708 RepID=A0A9D0Z6B5_9FIRM|nr:MBL fold metallo-hydrolase [Candidatus Avoscillospira stercorigallinarum]